MELNLSNYKPKLLVTAIGLMWLLFSWALSNIWGYGLLQGIGPTAVVMMVFSIYDRRLWKVPGFNLLNTVPNLNGTYKGEISFNFQGQDGKKAIKMQVKQTCSHIKITSYFSKPGEKDTQSTSSEAFIKTDPAGDKLLYFYYHNRGSNESGDTLDPHDGMNVLEIHEDSDDIRLSGYYFTNRNPQTKGSMSVTRKSQRGI